MQHHRARHQREGERGQRLAILDAQFRKLRAEQARDRDQHHAARPDPGDHGLFLPGQPGADQRDQHRHGPRHQHHHQHEEQRAQIDAEQLRKAQRGGEQDEHARHENDRRMFLEPPDLLQRGQVRVGQNHAHHRDGQQAAFVQHGIRDRIDREHRAEQHRHLHVLGHLAPAEGPGEQTPARIAQDRGDGDPLHQMPDRGTQRGGRIDRHHHLVGEHGGQRADGIVDDGFPFQDLPRSRAHPRLPQQRHDDRGSGDDHDAAKDDGAFPAQPRAIADGEGGHQPAQRRADHHQPHDRRPRIAQAAEIQRQPALEQDHRDRDRDDGLEQVAEHRLGVEQPGQRPRDDACRQHQHDRRKLEAPGQPLRADAKRADDGEGRDGVHAMSSDQVPDAPVARDAQHPGQSPRGQTPHVEQEG